MIDEEIAVALQLIKEKTGIDVPDIFKKEETKLMKKKWTVVGEYQPFGFEPYYCAIYLRPSLDVMMTYDDAYRTMTNMGCTITCDEQVMEYLKAVNQSRKWSKIGHIIHECGHFVHDKYFHNKAMYLPVVENSHRVEKAHQNARENFAVAFEEYVLDKIPKESKRYKKIETILHSIK